MNTNDGGPMLDQLSASKKRGCPTCDGIDPRTCLRCRGKTRLCDWYNTPLGWAHGADAMLAAREREAGR